MGLCVFSPHQYDDDVFSLSLCLPLTISVSPYFSPVTPNLPPHLSLSLPLSLFICQLLSIPPSDHTYIQTQLACFSTYKISHFNRVSHVFLLSMKCSRVLCGAQSDIRPFPEPVMFSFPAERLIPCS